MNTQNNNIFHIIYHKQLIVFLYFRLPNCVSFVISSLLQWQCAFVERHGKNSHYRSVDNISM
jgi:hypothetical protein